MVQVFIRRKTFAFENIAMAASSLSQHQYQREALQEPLHALICRCPTVVCLKSGENPFFILLKTGISIQIPEGLLLLAQTYQV